MKRPTFRSTALRVVVLALGATALIALPAMSQDQTPSAPQDQTGPPHGGRGGPGGMGGRQLEFLTKQLNLTSDQVTQIKAIDEDTWKQAKAVRDDTSIVGQDKRTKMMEIHKASQDKIRALLTADQQTKFDALQAQMRERRGNHGGGDGPPPPPSAPQQ